MFLVQQRQSHCGKAKDPVAVHEADYLSHPSPVLESWRVPKEVPVFCLHPNNRTDELVLESEDKQAKSQSFLLPHSFQWAATQKAWSKFRVCFPTSND